jgi:hypothetical protein
MAAPPLSYPPRSAGDILDHAVRLYRRHFLSVIRLVLPPFLAIIPLSILLEVISENDETLGISHQQTLLLGAITWFEFLVDGALARWLFDPELGKAVHIWKCYRPVLRRGLSLAAGVLLIQGLTFVGLIGPGGIVVGMIQNAFASWSLSTALGLAFGTLMAGAIITGVMVILFRLSLFVVVIALENLRWPAALRRTWRLVHGNFWRAAAVMLFIMAITFCPMLLVELLGSLSGGRITPVVKRFLTDVVSLGLSPIGGIALGFLYFDCSVRKEGLDLDTMAQSLGAPDQRLQSPTEV